MKTTTGEERHMWAVSFEDTRGNETKQVVAGMDFDAVYLAAKEVEKTQRIKLLGIVRGGKITVLDVKA